MLALIRIVVDVVVVPALQSSAVGYAVEQTVQEFVLHFRVVHSVATRSSDLPAFTYAKARLWKRMLRSVP